MSQRDPGKRGSLRKPGLRDGTSLELQMRFHSRLVPASLTAGKEPWERNTATPDSSQVTGWKPVPWGDPLLPPPLASQSSVPAWGPRSWTLPGSMELSSQQGAESPSAEGRLSGSHPQLQGYFQLTGCKDAVGGFQDRRRVLSGAGNH